MLQLATAQGGWVDNFFIQAVEAGKTWEWNGWVALNEGDSLVVYTDQQLVGYWVSGSVLVGEPLYTIPPNLTTGTKPGSPATS